MLTPVFDAVTPAEQFGARGFGYFSGPGAEFPLEELWLHADLAGLAGSVELRATFYNDGFNPIEATYIFPLPELGSVNSLQIRTGATVIDGWLLERAEARDRYAASLVDKDKAAILEQEREDVVTIGVGTIKPGERVSVRLTLCMPLSYNDGEILFRFPLVVAPRYIAGTPLPVNPVGGGTAADTNLVPDASRIAPPVHSGSTARLLISIDIAAQAFLVDEIGCTLRTSITSAEGDQTLRIEAHPGQRLDRDLVLRIRTAAHSQPSLSLLTSTDGDGHEGTFALTVLPPTVDQSPSAARDVVVLVDVSATMSGWRLSAARRAATQIIDALAAFDRFTLLLFADAVTDPGWGATELVEASARNRFRAVEHLISTQADGNPALLPALESATRLLLDPNRESMLAVITGGLIANEDQIAASFTPRAGGVRIHTLGIGATVNAGLLRSLANVGRGEMLLVATEDDLDDLTPSLLRLLGPAFLTNLSLTGSGIRLLSNSISPRRPPDIFSGMSSVITGRFRGDAQGAVVVSGTGIDGRPWSSRVDAVPAPGRALTPTWARAFLADLQHKYLRCRIEDAAGLERLIVATSLRFSVLTRLTAFVAVSNAPRTSPGAPRPVIQSVEFPTDWVEPAPGWSPYAAEYARILASASRQSAAPATSHPVYEPRTTGEVTATGGAPVTASPPRRDIFPDSAAPGSSYSSAPSAAPPPYPQAVPLPPMAFPPSGPVAFPPAGPMAPPPRQHKPSRRGRYLGAGAAAVIAAGVLGVGVTLNAHLRDSASSPAQQTSAPSAAPRAGARLAITVTPQGTGSQVRAEVSGLPSGAAVRLVVVGRDGMHQKIDEWVAQDGTSVRTATSTLAPNRIASATVEDTTGHTYVSAVPQ